MAKLYVFGIGGTGSRVIKSLTMLLASGVKCGVDTIVPIIIDPDAAGADITRTIETLKRYNAVRKSLNNNSDTTNSFFKTAIEESVKGYRLPINNTNNDTFRKYMGVDSMSKSEQALVSMLFSEKNLQSEMSVGFKGNPNIGSVVLNKFDNSPEFKEFANDFKTGDKIFIVSSIFGGTGASGFPLLLKTLRGNREMPNFASINGAQIGAISVLPYFGVEPGGEVSQIDSGTFISKTKSALHYYAKNISGNNSATALYYIGDDRRSNYKNSEGGAEQKNSAHFVELASALAILDFASADYSDSNTTQHKEFGISADREQIIFEDLGGKTQKLLKKPLTQFYLFSKYMQEECYREHGSQPWAKAHKVDGTFLDGPFSQKLVELQSDYCTWLVEMSTNDRSFSPFELSVMGGSFDFVKGVSERKVMSMKSKYALFNDRLNSQKIRDAAAVEQRFVELFYQATEKLVTEKYNF